MTSGDIARSLDRKSIGCSLSCRIQLKDGISRDYFHSIALTADGEILAATGGGAHEADNLESLCGLRLWHLSRSIQDEEIVAVKIPISPDIMELFVEDVNCQTLAFSSDGNSLCVTICGTDSVKLVLLDIEKPNKHRDSKYHVTIRHVINHSKEVKSKLGRDLLRSVVTDKLSTCVSSLAYSSDGQWLCVCSCDKLVCIYEIDRLALHWNIPSLQSPVSCIAFHPQSPNSLITVLSGDNSFQIFNVQDKTLTPWSLENQDLIPSWASSLGKAASGSVMNISFDPTCVSAFVMHGQSFSIYINLDRAIPVSNISNSSTHAAVNFSPQAVTQTMLTSPRAPSRVEFLQRELHDLVPTDQKYLKKKKKLQRLLEAESKLSADSMVTSEVENPSKKLKKQQKNKEKEVTDPIPVMRNFSILKSHRSIVHLAILNSHEMVTVLPS